MEVIVLPFYRVGPQDGTLVVRLSDIAFTCYAASSICN